MKTTKEIAVEIVDRRSWSSNVLRDGRLVGLQYVVAEDIATAIRTAIAAEREACAKVAEELAKAPVSDDDLERFDCAEDYIAARIRARKD